MTILALEFSSGQRSVAVARGSSVLSETIEAGGHSAAAFGMIEKVLTDAKTERERVEAIAVGLGPGSYTGIRAAISMAQGWRLAREIKLIGVSSVEAIAAQAQHEKIFGRVNVVIDAQRGEVYRAQFEISASERKEIQPLRILSPAQMPSRADELFIGPEATRWFPAGRVVFPRAVAIAALTAGRRKSATEENLEPIYLRETTFVKQPRAGTTN